MQAAPACAGQARRLHHRLGYDTHCNELLRPHAGAIMRVAKKLPAPCQKQHQLP